MAIKDFYGEKKKKKDPYSTYNAAAPQTQNMLQSNAVQRPKREKTPSELGEEVVRLMLEEEFPEKRQSVAKEKTAGQALAGSAAPQAKTDVWNQKAVSLNDPATGTGSSAATASYRSTPAAPSGGVNAAPYSDTYAVPYGAATTLHNSTFTAPFGSAVAAPYGGAATVQYNRPTAAEPAIQKREKTPSELGDEME